MFYEEDRFLPNNMDEDELSFQPYQTSIRKLMADTIENDPNMFRLKKNGRTITYFSCNGNIGRFIRNAVTGVVEKGDYVGSWKEDYYFKVNVATGGAGQRCNILFYDSPEQYEKHMMCEVSQQIKEKWREKFRSAKKRIESVENPTANELRGIVIK